MRDFVGFLTFTILILSSLFVVWFGLRSYGLSQPVSQYKTPLVEQLLQQADPAPLLWTQQPAAEQTWAMAQFQNQQWVMTKEPQQKLADWLQANRTQKKLLFFEDTEPKALPALRKILQRKDAWKQTLLCSRFDGLLKDLRELEPRWSFCSGEIYMTRLLALSSLGLESLLSIPADVVFIHMQNISAPSEVSTIIQEAKRQNKLILIGPVTRPLESYNPHGWVVD